MGYPKCFKSQKEFDEWCKIAAASGVNEPEKNFCISCTPKYQTEAIALDICKYPYAFQVFVKDENGEYEGIFVLGDL